MYLNNVIKLDPSHVPIISRLKNNKPENYIFDDIKKLWYFQNYKKKYKLIDILYSNEKILKVEFKNGDYNDYIESNLILTKNLKFQDNFNPPDNIEIINTYDSIKITEGKYAGQYRNKYWEVKDKKNYIIMHIKDNIYTKFSKEDSNKVLMINDKRPVWYLNDNGYIATTLRTTDNTYFYYLHQLIMNQHTKDNTDFKETVDHINQDKLDNRKENLRIVDMSEQNKNKGKQTRRCDAITELPEGIKVLPKYVQYRKEIYDKDNNSQREFFIISHPKLDKIWETTKSNKVSIFDKLKYANAKLKLIEGIITEAQFKEIIGNTDKIIFPLGITLDIFREKYHFILDWRNGQNRYNAKMILHSTDVQKEFDIFIDTVVNVKYPDLKMEKINLNIQWSPEPNLVSQSIKPLSATKNPAYPQYISIFEVKGNKYIQYSRQIKGVKYNKKNKMLSNDIQNEIDKLVIGFNEKYPTYNLENLKI